MRGTGELAVIDPYVSPIRQGTWAALKLAEVGVSFPRMMRRAPPLRRRSRRAFGELNIAPSDIPLRPTSVPPIPVQSGCFRPRWPPASARSRL